VVIICFTRLTVGPAFNFIIAIISLAIVAAIFITVFFVIPVPSNLLITIEICIAPAISLLITIAMRSGILVTVAANCKIAGSPVFIFTPVVTVIVTACIIPLLVSGGHCPTKTFSHARLLL